MSHGWLTRPVEAWRAWIARQRAAAAGRQTAAEERWLVEVQAARRLARARLVVRRPEIADRWRMMEGGSPRLAEVAAEALAMFLDGANPPRCLPDDRLPPLHAVEWRWRTRPGEAADVAGSRSTPGP